MKIKHGADCVHEVYLLDDGTPDTVVEVDGHEVRYVEADRRRDGSVKTAWLVGVAVEACIDGLLEEEETR
jgi:hypothetical protein